MTMTKDKCCGTCKYYCHEDKTMVEFVLMTETKNEKEENNEIQGWRQGKN